MEKVMNENRTGNLNIRLSSNMVTAQYKYWVYCVTNAMKINHLKIKWKMWYICLDVFLMFLFEFLSKSKWVFVWQTGKLAYGEGDGRGVEKHTVCPLSPCDILSPSTEKTPQWMVSIFILTITTYNLLILIDIN